MEKTVKRKSFEIDMTSGPILSKLMLFVMPLMLSSMLQLLFNAADIIVVGRYAGDDALAAVGSNTALINLLTNFFMGLSVGVNVLAARYIGSGEKENLKKTVHTAIAISIVSGIFLTLVGVIGARQILIWMQTPAEVLDLATTYLRIYFLGMTSTMIYNFGAAILRAFGDTKRPLYYLFFAGVINVILNLILVICFDMSVAGVAIATAISQTISASLIITCMIKDKGGMHLELRNVRIDPSMLKKILYVGLPASFQGILFALSNVVIQSSVNSFGRTVMSGNSAAANIEGFVYMAMNAFYQGTISFTSQNYGAGKNERIKKILITSEICVIITGLTFGNLAVFFGKELLSIYSDSPEVIAAGMDRLHVISATYFLCGMMEVMVGVLRGLGYSVMPMLVSLVGACLLRLLWIFTLFQWTAFHTIKLLYATYPVSWILTFLAHVICYYLVWGRKHTIH